MAIRLYTLDLSNPAQAVRAMMALKRIDHLDVRLPAGVHPLLVRAAGFDSHTVPALELDGRRVQGSLAISRALEALRPHPPLFPPEPAARRRVEEAEAWGEAVLQHVPRRLFRWALSNDPELRRWMASDVLRWPLPRVVGPLAVPLVRWLTAAAGATNADFVRDELRALPGHLDHVDALIDEGVIGGERPNAADFQILASVRLLLQFEDLRALVAGRPCEAPARALYPEWRDEVPPCLPREWLRAPAAS